MRVELSFHGRHHGDLQLIHLQGKPLPFQFSDPVFSRYGASQPQHFAEGPFYDLFYGSELVAVPGYEVLMGVAVAGVTIDNRLLDTALLCQ